MKTTIRVEIECGEYVCGSCCLKRYIPVINRCGSVTNTFVCTGYRAKDGMPTWLTNVEDSEHDCINEETYRLTICLAGGVQDGRVDALCIAEYASQRVGWGE